MSEDFEFKMNWRRRFNWWLRRKKWWNNIRQLSWFTITVAVVLLVVGSLGLTDMLPISENLEGEFIGIGVTVLLVDTELRLRAIQETKKRLIREMASRDNAIALRAVEELRADGWLFDGSLQRVELKRANLQEANLVHANLRGAHLVEARMNNAKMACANLREAVLISANLQGATMMLTNLQGANMGFANLKGANLIASSQLSKAKILLGATLPDGTRLPFEEDLGLAAFETWCETVELMETGFGEFIIPAKIDDPTE